MKEPITWNEKGEIVPLTQERVREMSAKAARDFETMPEARTVRATNLSLQLLRKAIIAAGTAALLVILAVAAFPESGAAILVGIAIPSCVLLYTEGSRRLFGP